MIIKLLRSLGLPFEIPEYDPKYDIGIQPFRFLNACESAGMSILHCSPYIREWMLQERDRPKEQPELL